MHRAEARFEKKNQAEAFHNPVRVCFTSAFNAA